MQHLPSALGAYERALLILLQIFFKKVVVIPVLQFLRNRRSASVCMDPSGILSGGLCFSLWSLQGIRLLGRGRFFHPLPFCWSLTIAKTVLVLFLSVLLILQRTDNLN